MQIWGQGIFLTIFGMVIIFLCLIALNLIIHGLNRLFREPPSGEAPSSLKTSQQKASPPAEDLTPVVSAAAAAYLEAQTGEGFHVSVRREVSSRWVADGRQAAISRSEHL